MRVYSLRGLGCAVTGLLILVSTSAVSAQVPGHPIISEVYNDSIGLDDGALAWDPANINQEYIELYLPDPIELDASSLTNPDIVRLTLYEIEGDSTSSGNELVNYRIDLPIFDLNPGNGISVVPGEVVLERPPNGVVVLGWVKYLNSMALELDGTPNTRLALINGGVTSTAADGFMFIAINGAEGSGTLNFPVPKEISLIHIPNEATSGIIQNGSAAYLLVDRDAPGYVKLYDDKDAAFVPPLSNADPALADGTVLKTTCLLDSFAGNDHSKFDVTKQPYEIPTGDDIDLETVLCLPAVGPPACAGPFSFLTPQIDEDRENGYSRLFVDRAKTTEDLSPLNDDPVIDAEEVYRTIANLGPMIPTPGRAPKTTSPGELAIADATLQLFDVLKGTTGRPGMITANVGGDMAMTLTATPGMPLDDTIVALGPGEPAVSLGGQITLFPSVAVTPGPATIDGSTTTAPVGIAAAGPDVINPNDATVATFRVIDPKQGLAADAITPFQATVLVAVQGLPASTIPGVTNEFLGTSLSDFVIPNLGGLVDDERNNGLILTDPLTDLSDALLINALEDGMPDIEAAFINPPSPAALDDLVTTVLNSAEVLALNAAGNGPLNATYDNIFNLTFTALRGLELTIGVTRTLGGPFTPTERVHFADPKGRPGAGDSGLSDADATQGFELALIDSNVQANGMLESGATDDFGLVVEVGRVRAGATVQTGEFVFLSVTGGFEGADIDSIDVPPHNNQTVIIYVDLDNLDTELGCETITRLYVIDGSGNGTLNVIEAFSLNVDAACASPTLVTQPASQSDCSAGAAAFSVTATGTPPLSFQWRKNGINILGETTSTLTINPISALDAGSYDVIVSDVCGATFSNPATLTIAVPPSIVMQPMATSACPGQAAVFTTTAVGGAPLSFQWQRGGINLVDGGNISGATSSTLQIFPVAAGDAATDYRCTVTGGCTPSATSSNATLTIVECGPVVVEALGSRYLAVTPDFGVVDPIALRVTSPDHPCQLLFIQPNGSLDIAPVFLTPQAWGTVLVSDIFVVPESTYLVQTETPLGVLSMPESATTYVFADIDNDLDANFADIFLAVQGFQGDFSNAALEAMDIHPCIPNQFVNFGDIFGAVIGFQNGSHLDLGCEALCP